MQKKNHRDAGVAQQFGMQDAVSSSELWEKESKGYRDKKAENETVASQPAQQEWFRRLSSRCFKWKSLGEFVAHRPSGVRRG